MSAELIVPGEAYLHSYLEACRGFKERRVGLYSLHDPDTFEEWRHTIFRRFAEQRLGIGLPDGYVPGSTYWLVEGGEFIGVGNIRHRLTRSLERYGGHIGYAIRCEKWGQGYGTLQLRLLLREAAALGIARALITCDESNIASARVMEKNGAVYQDTVVNWIGGVPRRTKRYWAETTA
ncbi:MAG: GNAT family N-acetyltransferase [Clostridia bacterium]|nr:GNAT family N-acetyltransferase [Clostridia bacterium]